MGAAHLAASACHKDLEIALICDPAAHQAPRPLASFNDVVADPSIAGLIVAAPTVLHAEIVAAALTRGKHVLCEKPLGFRPADALALAAQAEAAGLVLQIGFWRRFARPYRVALEVIASGRIGKVGSIRMAQWDAAPPPPGFCDPRVSGGLEIDCGVHEFDLARWACAAEISWVTGAAAPVSPMLQAVGDVDTVQGLAQLANGVVMSIDLTRRAGYRDSIRTEFVGECGSLVVAFADAGAVSVQWADNSEQIPHPDLIIGEALRAQLAAFAAAVRSGVRHPQAGSAIDAARALEAALALRDARDRRVWRRSGPGAGTC